MVLIILTGLLLLSITAPVLATDFPHVTYHRCYDGDTCTFTIPGIHPLFGEQISVRIAGIEPLRFEGSVKRKRRWPCKPGTSPDEC